jgi:hypothetical protein
MDRLISQRSSIYSENNHTMNNQDTGTEPKLVSKMAIVVDLLLTLIFYGMMAVVLIPFVPMQGKGEPEIWAAFTAIPLAGVFWLLVQMFRVTLTDQLRRSKGTKQR